MLSHRLALLYKWDTKHGLCMWILQDGQKQFEKHGPSDIHCLFRLLKTNVLTVKWTHVHLVLLGLSLGLYLHIHTSTDSRHWECFDTQPGDKIYMLKDDLVQWFHVDVKLVGGSIDSCGTLLTSGFGLDFSHPLNTDWIRLWRKITAMLCLSLSVHSAGMEGSMYWMASERSRRMVTIPILLLPSAISAIWCRI